MSSRSWCLLWAAGIAIAPAALTNAESILYVNGSCGNDTWTGSSAVCLPPDGPKATIQAGIDAAVDGDEVIVADGVYTGSGNRELDYGGRNLTVRSANGPDNCVIDCEGAAGRAFSFTHGESTDAVVSGFTITNGSSSEGAIRIYGSGSSATIMDCIFTNNTSGIGGAIYGSTSGTVILVRCTFVGNAADLGGGALFVAGGNQFTPKGSFAAIDCVFAGNEAMLGGPGGAATRVADATYVNCLFADNFADFVGGGLVEGSTTAALINCAFSRNVADHGGAAEMGSLDMTMINCTLSQNEGTGLRAATCETFAMTNSILWGNVPDQIKIRPEHTLTHCDVQGGWAGAGNIDADPLFVQPGNDDVRLSFGSPCIDAGSNAALPADSWDLDGDGDTGEVVPLDLDGNARILRASVDLGAYEGEYDPALPADGDDDLDEGEFAFLIPEGGIYNPIETAAALVVNDSAGDNASVVVTQHGGQMHPGAGGYSEAGVALECETSMADGQFFTRVSIPFDMSDLKGAKFYRMSVTRYDPVTGNWGLAVAGNMTVSPGFGSPIGDRVIVVGGGDWGLTWDRGDHGVYWDPDTNEGFAWANVDYASTWTAGEPYCPSDCLQPPDGVVDVRDLIFVLDEFGQTSGGPSDVDFTGLVEVADVEHVLDDWGPCGQPAYGQPGHTNQGPQAPAVQPRAVRAVSAPLADVNSDGRVDSDDLLALKASWGECEHGCASDLDRNGTVDAVDLLSLLAAWPTDAESRRTQAAEAAPPGPKVISRRLLLRR